LSRKGFTVDQFELFCKNMAIKLPLADHLKWQSFFTGKYMETYSINTKNMLIYGK
jgi:hypothetical protein